jgi:hypothetical protein
MQAVLVTPSEIWKISIDLRHLHVRPLFGLPNYVDNGRLVECVRDDILVLGHFSYDFL